MFLCFVAKNRKIGTFWLFGAPVAGREWCAPSGRRKNMIMRRVRDSANQFRMIALCDGDNLFSVFISYNAFLTKFRNNFWIFRKHLHHFVSFFLEISHFSLISSKKKPSQSRIWQVLEGQNFVRSVFFFMATAKVVFSFFFYRKRDGASWASHSSCLESSERSARSARELKTKSSTSFFAGIRVWLLGFFSRWLDFFVGTKFLANFGSIIIKADLPNFMVITSFLLSVLAGIKPSELFFTQTSLLVKFHRVHEFWTRSKVTTGWKINAKSFSRKHW